MKGAVHTMKYYCDLTGATDATGCLNNWIAAVPAGGIGVMDPGIYKIAGHMNCFDKGMTIFSYGATVNFVAGSTNFCTHSQGTGQLYGTTTPYPLNAASFNAIKVFTATAGDAAHFPAGTHFWIVGTPSNNDSYSGLSIGNNASTGEIDLDRPLPKNILAPANIYDVGGQTTFNFSWYGGTFNDPTGTPLNISQTQSFRFQDQTWTGATQIANGYNADGVFDHFTYKTCDQGIFDAEAASERISWSYSTALCPTPGSGGALHPINIGEGSSNVSIDHCLLDLRNYAASGGSIYVTVANFVSFTYDTIYANGGSAMTLNGMVGDGGLNTPSFIDISHNSVWNFGNSGIVDGSGWTRMGVSFNNIFPLDLASSGNGSALQVGSPGEVLGNYLNGNVGLDLQYNNVANAGPTISDNTINGLNPAQYAIIVRDPGTGVGTPPSPDARIVDNRVTDAGGSGHLINYVSSANVPNIVVQGNSGISDRTPNILGQARTQSTAGK